MSNLNADEESMWRLIEQDLIPSCHYGARLDYLDILANAWEAGRKIGRAEANAEDNGNAAFDYTPNPYRASETA